MVIKDLEEYSVVSFDLDGTITESRQPIEQNMVDLLFKLSEKVLVVIISGSSFENLLNQLGLLLNTEEKKYFKNILLMPANGSQTYSYNEEKDVWEISNIVSMPDEVKSRIQEILKQVISSKDFGLPEEIYGELIEDRGTQVSISALGNKAPLEEKKIWDPTQSKREKVVKFIAPLLPEADIFIAGTTTIDILPKGVTKGIMLEKMLLNRKLQKSDLLFIGDALYKGGNDYEVRREGFATTQTSGPIETAHIIENILKQ